MLEVLVFFSLTRHDKRKDRRMSGCSPEIGGDCGEPPSCDSRFRIVRDVREASDGAVQVAVGAL